MDLAFETPLPQDEGPFPYRSRLCGTDVQPEPVSVAGAGTPAGEEGRVDPHKAQAQRKAGPQSTVALGTSLQARQQMPSAKKQELVYSTYTFSTNVCTGVKNKQHS